MIMEGLKKPAGIVQSFLEDFNGIFSIIRHYYPDLAPSNYHLFTLIQRELAGCEFSEFKNDIEVKHTELI